MTFLIHSIDVAIDQDVVLARRTARQVASLLGFEPQDQTRIATSVSEIARNAVQYAGSGTVEFRVAGKTEPQLLRIRICDPGPGIPDKLLAGNTGSGLGIIGARRLMDQFHIDSIPGRGTTVWMGKVLPRRSKLLDQDEAASIRRQLQARDQENPFEEIRRQNQELMRALEELRSRQEELTRVNRELEDTNRGVVALYAELDERADHLRRADDMKSRFLSNMSHEFRTPLNSIIALSRLLKDRVDGDLTTEQERQVSLVQAAAQNLSELVNDLLDLAKVQAGKVTVRPSSFGVAALFSALRGMLRPLLLSQSVNLVFEDPERIPEIYSDEAKVSQILRNFISNALKFTEHGEVRVRAALVPEKASVLFSVADTGIGIEPRDFERIFQEFTQLDNPLQRKVKGTGLGLPLCRRLAELLGGGVSVESEPGKGSTFSVRVPLQYNFNPEPEEIAPTQERVPDTLLTPVLVVEDNAETVMLYNKLLRGTGFRLIPARTVGEARELLSRRPSAIVLDILLGGEDAWSFLAELKSSPESRDIPVLVVTSVDDRDKGIALGADAYYVKPLDRRWLLEELNARTTNRREKILVVDDDEAARYLFRQLLADTRFTFLEASTGRAGIDLVRSERPAAIILDLAMPGMSGETVMRTLKGDPATAAIPIVIATSTALSEEELARLLADAAVVISKSEMSGQSARHLLHEALAAAGAGAR